jgi:hypothetical protein
VGKERWLTSRQVVAFLANRRYNDVKVQLNGNYVPIVNIFYNLKARMVYEWNARAYPVIMKHTVCRMRGHWFKFGHLGGTRCLRCNADILLP